MLLHIGDSLLSRYKHIGCHRPLGAIQTRAHERTQRQAKASFSRVQGETSYMESITKSIQGKFTRESTEAGKMSPFKVRGELYHLLTIQRGGTF